MSEEGKKDGAGVAVALFVMVMLLIAMWPFYRPYVARGVLTITRAECRMVAAFHQILPAGYKRQLVDTYRGTDRLLKRPGVKHLKELRTGQFMAAWNVPSKALVPFMLIAVLAGCWHIKATDIAQRFRKRYSLEELIKAQAEFYPHLRPLAKVRVDKEPLRRGDWRIKYSDIDFALKHQLLRDGAGQLVQSADYDLRAAFFDSQRATAVFKAQLGKRWSDKLEDLLPHERAMFGVLAAMVCRERKVALAALAEMSSSWSKVTPKGAPHYYTIKADKGEAAARQFWDHEDIKRIRAAHAYVLTVFSALAAKKRNSGELACSHYIWLRPTDPRLFYTLHQEGLPRPNLESAAAFVHFELEQRAQMAINEPDVDRAVTALRVSLVRSGYLTPSVTSDGAGGRDWAEDTTAGYSRSKPGLVL